VQSELIPPQSAAQVSFQRHSRCHSSPHVGSEELVAVPALLFSLVHGYIRVTHQGFGILRVGRVCTSPDAHVDIETFAVDHVRRGYRAQDFSRRNGCVLRVLYLREEYQEFVPAQPAYRVRPSDARYQSPGYRPQQPVPDAVAERIVDSLELIQVDEQNRELLALTLRKRDCL